jgi:protein arginine N-methyltransferase 5
MEFDMRLTAVEQNECAIPSLIRQNTVMWNGQVRIVHADARSAQLRHPAHLVISELLGSFGCNELSPECLHGARHLHYDDAIIIPQAYSSYLAPFNSNTVEQFIATHQQRLINMCVDCAFTHTDMFTVQLNWQTRPCRRKFKHV